LKKIENNSRSVTGTDYINCQAWRYAPFTISISKTVVYVREI